MDTFLFSVLLLGSSAIVGDGMIPAHDVAIGGVAIGDSPVQVESKLGKPRSKENSQDFLSLHYNYAEMRVSFSADVVAGLFTDSASACTPKHLCPGDSLDKMRQLYGEPLLSERETGRFYEYYGYDLYCWFQIPAQGTTVVSINAACQP